MNPGRHRPTRTPQNPHLRHLLLLLSRTPQNPHLLLLLLLPNVLAATTATTTTTTTLLLLRPPPPPPLLRRLILLLPLLLHSPLFLLIVVLIVLRPPPPPPSHGPFSSRQHALVTCPSQWPVSASPVHSGLCHLPLDTCQASVRCGRHCANDRTRSLLHIAVIISACGNDFLIV